MCIVVFIFIILAVFAFTKPLESLTGMGHLKSKWVDLQGDHRVKQWFDEKEGEKIKIKKDDQMPPIILKKGEEEKIDFERDVKRAETPSDTFGGEKPVLVSVSKQWSVNALADAIGHGAAHAGSSGDGYGFIKLTRKPIKGEAYSPAAAIIGFDESAMIRKKTNIPENIQREWDAEVYVKNKRKPASEDAWK